MNVKPLLRLRVRRALRRAPNLVRAAGLFALVAAPGLVAADDVLLARGEAGDVVVEDDTRARLAAGRDLFQRARADDFISQFTNERLEHLARPEQLQLFQSEQRFDDVFLDGDEAFEFEADRAMGAGSGAALPAPLPLPPSPVHFSGGPDGAAGDGGLDGASCRACHFSGGPDGAGSSTQRAFLRGDGRHLSSAVVRDAPHVMGLGYVSRLAREMEAELFLTLAAAEDVAATTAVPLVMPLSAKGIDFGELVARPGGLVDRSRVSGVSPDLVIRPFGHKGRHADLTGLVDEALEVHHGLQTASRLREAGASDPDGDPDGDDADGDDPDDPDGDGVVAAALWQDGQPGAEASSAQAVLLAGYLSLLGVPEIHPPRRVDLLVQWTRGRELLDETGCTLCHVERLSVNDSNVEVRARGGYQSVLAFDLVTHGQEPRALRTDDGPGGGPGGRIPIFAFTDLKRHDLGSALADAVDEVLPPRAALSSDGDGGGAAAVDVPPVAASEWLTRSLWGVADTAPYLHDGRAGTLHEAIVAHGGEAAGMRDAYLALDDDARAALRVFLMSLTRHATVIVE